MSGPRRSSTGHHRLLPASRPGTVYDAIPRVPAYSLISWTFGRGSVIWRIWPAVLLHTVFAAAVVTVSMREVLDLHIPSVMLTVVGVVIGFVISYRAMSGYDRYWLGRSTWSDVIKNARTLGRLVWFHVPPRLFPKDKEGREAGRGEMERVMGEKQMALDLVEGFAVALKHHIRGELGIYYEDLYHLVKPMHEHEHVVSSPTSATTSAIDANGPLSPRKAQRISHQPPVPQPHSPTPPAKKGKKHNRNGKATSPDGLYDPISIPPINAYGTFDPSNPSHSSQHPNRNSKHRLRRTPSSHSTLSARSTSTSDGRQPLLPSQPRLAESDTVMGKVSGDLIPFAGFFGAVKRGVGRTWDAVRRRLSSEREREVFPPGFVVEDSQPGSHKWLGPIHPSPKHRPKVAGGGENLPLEILRCLSEWLSVLEDRGTVPGTSLGTMIGSIAAFEESLTSLERILTTPLPFVYSVHIRTVWIYLFFLPFQLVVDFGYYTIPGVAIAAFIYLGFLAAGEEIEQPFGYDDNDLDLDLFCHEIIHADIMNLKTSPCLNAYLSPSIMQKHPHTVHRKSSTLVALSEQEYLENGEMEDLPGMA